ncbi:MAG: glycosyltransferase family 4 protein [Candidatus Thiocaldithrix dubininis]|uniref:Glycosyltransferase family 4 protein n=1 Tax=Candidatus Thiocaldithrix dubininis TaxID=3080823 RepID=A0AA95H8Z1_9GAMM|nr:MAG: glycosyltransferase family 4 protein [Candidatus Thiocaldithrix dubininis]
MRKILYIVGAALPSKNANSIHAYNMSKALAEYFPVVRVITQTTSNQQELELYYGSKNNATFIPSKYGILSRFFNMTLESKEADIIYTRWLWAALLLPFSKKIFYFELHSEPTSIMQKFLLLTIKKTKAKNVFISEELLNHMHEKYNIKLENSIVAHDGADAVIFQEDNEYPPVNSVGYIGSFKEGKGIDRIMKISEQLPDVTFHVFGGTKKDIVSYVNKRKNVIFHGFIAPCEIKNAMKKFHIAILPNEEKVLIKGHDIGRWTSPLKLFEYMSYGKPIVATDLRVFREILLDQETALLCDKHDINNWVVNIKIIINDPSVSKRLSMNAKRLFEEKFTWNKRVECIFNKNTNI